MKITKKQFQVGSIFKVLFMEEVLHSYELEKAGTAYKNEKDEDILYLLTGIEKDLPCWGDDAYLVNLEALNCNGMNIYDARVWLDNDVLINRQFEFVQ